MRSRFGHLWGENFRPVCRIGGRVRWSRGRVLASWPKVCGFKPGWGWWIFSGRIGPEHKSSSRALIRVFRVWDFMLVKESQAWKIGFWAKFNRRVYIQVIILFLLIWPRKLLVKEEVLPSNSSNNRKYPWHILITEINRIFFVPFCGLWKQITLIWRNPAEKKGMGIHAKMMSREDWVQPMGVEQLPAVAIVYIILAPTFSRNTITYFTGVGLFVR